MLDFFPVTGLLEPFFGLAGKLIDTAIMLADFFTQESSQWLDDILVALRPFWAGTAVEGYIYDILEQDIPLAFILLGGGLVIFLVLRVFKFIWECLPLV